MCRQTSVRRAGQCRGLEGDGRAEYPSNDRSEAIAHATLSLRTSNTKGAVRKERYIERRRDRIQIPPPPAATPPRRLPPRPPPSPRASRRLTPCPAPRRRHCEVMRVNRHLSLGRPLAPRRRRRRRLCDQLRFLPPGIPRKSIVQGHATPPPLTAKSTRVLEAIPEGARSARFEI